MEETYRIVVGKCEGKEPLEERSRRWEDIKIEPEEIGYEGIDGIDLPQDGENWRAFMIAVLNIIAS